MSLCQRSKTQHNTAQNTRGVSVATAGARLWDQQSIHAACTQPGITHVSTMTSSCVTFWESYGMWV